MELIASPQAMKPTPSRVNNFRSNDELRKDVRVARATIYRQSHFLHGYSFYGSLYGSFISAVIQEQRRDTLSSPLSLSSRIQRCRLSFFSFVFEKERRFLCDFSWLFSTSVRHWWRSDITSCSVPSIRNSLKSDENFSSFKSQTIRMCHLSWLCCS